MTDEELPSRIFSLDDQIAFARLSSDWNPMHLDRAFARRTQVGAAVVDGRYKIPRCAGAGGRMRCCVPIPSGLPTYAPDFCSHYISTNARPSESGIRQTSISISRSSQRT